MYVRKEDEKSKIIVSTGLQRLRNDLLVDRRSLQAKEIKDADLLLLDPQPLTDTSRSETNFMKTNADDEIKTPSIPRPEYVPTPDISLMEFFRTVWYVTAVSKIARHI